MTTTQRQHRSPYAPEHAEQVAKALERDPYYLDDTLDAYPPLHLFSGPSTPEEIAAARAHAAARGLLPRSRRGGSAQTPGSAAKTTKAKK